MDGQGTQADALAFQIDFYSSITIDTAVFIVDRLNLLLYLLFWGIGIRLPLFQEVVICIGSDAYTTQKPSYSKYFVIFLNLLSVNLLYLCAVFRTLLSDYQQFLL